MKTAKIRVGNVQYARRFNDGATRLQIEDWKRQCRQTAQMNRAADKLERLGEAGTANLIRQIASRLTIALGVTYFY